MTTATNLKVANDCRVETERFLRTFDSLTGVSPRLDEHATGTTSTVFPFGISYSRAVPRLTG
jgi:hypothetical protein